MVGAVVFINLVFTTVVFFVDAVNINCNDGKFYIRADPESCSHFYMCDNGNPVRKVCGTGTLYNPDTHNCDFPYNVKCSNKQPQGSTSSHTNNGNGYTSSWGHSTAGFSGELSYTGQSDTPANHKPSNTQGQQQYTQGQQQYTQGQHQYTQGQQQYTQPQNSPSQYLEDYYDDFESFEFPSPQNHVQASDGSPSTQKPSDGGRPSTQKPEGGRPRPTIDDLFSANQNPYQDYLPGNSVGDIRR